MTLAIFPCSFAAKTSIDIISGSPDGQSTGFRCEPYMVLCELQVRSAAHTEYGFSAFPQAGQGDVVLGTETGIILVECFDIEGTGILGKREDNVLQQKYHSYYDIAIAACVSEKVVGRRFGKLFGFSEPNVRGLPCK